MPGAALLDLTRAATSDLLLVAPYIKVAALRRVLDACPPGTSVSVVTRWRPEELALGVSDISVWPLLKARPAELFLHPRLHAKYYAAGDKALIGSANLTDAALGWAPNPNLEILSGAERARFAAFEETLSEALVPVDDRLYDLFLRALETFPPPPRNDTSLDATLDREVFERWRPALRHPADLYLAYSGEVERLTSASRNAAASDLLALGIGPGLNYVQFEGSVSLLLRQHPEVIAIDTLAAQQQRFGAFRALMSRRGAPNGGHAWQTWMRWLLHFFPRSYQMQEANYSEIFSHIPAPEEGGGGTAAGSIRQARD